MKLEIETLKGLDKDKIYWLQVNCNGLPDRKAEEKIKATMDALKELNMGLKFFVTNEDGTIRPVQEMPKEYVEPYFFGWVVSQWHPELTEIKCPSDIMYSCVKNEYAEIGDYVEVRRNDHKIVSVIKPPKGMVIE
jgi:hypothetical protein